MKKKIKYSASFVKSYKSRIKIDPNLVDDFIATREILLQTPKDIRLNRHFLKRQYKNVESINVNSDHRILFVETVEYFLFIDIGNHRELYG